MWPLNVWILKYLNTHVYTYRHICTYMFRYSAVNVLSRKLGKSKSICPHEPKMRDLLDALMLKCAEIGVWGSQGPKILVCKTRGCGRVGGTRRWVRVNAQRYMWHTYNIKLLVWRYGRTYLKIPADAKGCIYVYIYTYIYIGMCRYIRVNL